MDREYTVTITEVRKVDVKIDAANACEAADMAQWLLDDEQIVLGSICRTDTRIEVKGHLMP